MSICVRFMRNVIVCPHLKRESVRIPFQVRFMVAIHADVGNMSILCV